MTVTDPRMTRYFMSTDEAVRLVLLGASLPGDHQVLALEMGEQVNIYALAERMIRLCGLRPHDDIEIKVTGLRPGERLAESLIGPAETSAAEHGGPAAQHRARGARVRRGSRRAWSSSSGSPSTTTTSPRVRCCSTSRVRPRTTSDRTPTPRSARPDRARGRASRRAPPT